MKLNKRILSALLALILFATNLPVVSFASDTFAITYEGKAVTGVEFYKHEKIEVRAENIPEGTHQWQINIPGTEQWVNIQGQTEQTIRLSYAVVGSLLVDGSASVRCAAVSGGQEVAYTEPLCVTVAEEPAVEAAPAPAAPAVKAPIEATEAPTEAVGETEPEEIPTEAVGETEPEEIPAETVGETVPAEAPAEEKSAVSFLDMMLAGITAPTANATEPSAEETEPSAEETEPSTEETTAEKPAESFADLVTQVFAPVTAADGDPDPADPPVTASTDIVSVTIEYYYQNRLGERGEKVMDPYVARIVKGEDLTVTVACKVFPGYEIILVGEHEGLSLNDKNELIINLHQVAESKIYEIHYREIEVPYYARFFLQNVYNDLYTERTNVLTQDQINQMKGFAGEQPDESLIHPNITGFTALFHQPDKIAADGSTVFEVYYDRNYHLINFDLNGGYGTAPVYARFETAFTVATPTRPGYSFDGWQLVSGTVPADAEKDANGLVKKIPASNVTYRAKWTQQQTSYTVVYWKENVENSQYTYWGSDERKIKTGSTVSGADDIPQLTHKGEKGYFTFNSLLSDKNILVEGDGTTVVNVYYTRNYYTLTFRATGTCTIPEGHTHTDACYRYLCFGEEHAHTPACLDCKLGEHTHSIKCCILDGNHTHDERCCVLTPHTTHNATCCTKDVHTAHTSLSCFTTQDTDLVGDSGDHRNRVNNISSPIAGRVYKYRVRNYYYYYYSYYNYFYDGSNWYYLGTGDDGYAGIDVTISADGGWTNNYKSGVPTANCSTEIHTHGDGKCTCPNTHTHGDGCTCSLHVHGDGNCICSTPEHTHTKVCYKCGKMEHAHTTACRALICTFPTNHTHSNACRGNSVGGEYTYTVKTVTRKYQASLYDIWHQDQANGTDFGLKDDNGKIYNSGQRWKPSDNPYYNEVLVYIADMPGASFDLDVDSGSGKADYTMNYYLQVLPGQTYDKEYNDKYYILSNTVKAKYGHITKNEDFFDIKGYVQSASDPEFVGNNSNPSISPSDGIADFYYDRITDHVFEFTNNSEPMADKQVDGIMFGAPLKDYYFEPDYPSNLEKNAYVFDQWYTSDGYYEGTEVNWDTLTMPEGNLRLHARWLPVTYDVYFYMDYDRYDDGVCFQSVEDTNHGEPMLTSGLNLTPTHDTNPSYDFIGWFYIDSEGKKTAFNPAEMAVRQDLHLYAEWSSMTVKEYTVSYAQGKWDEETKTVVPLTGDDYRALSKNTTGYAFEASTRTFAAKPENQLENLTIDEMVGSIWVPHTNSHSILMNADNSQNVFTFWYVPRQNIPYTVRYLDSATGEPVIVNNAPKDNKVVEHNPDAVVTEQFEYVPGYIPDAFHKTLILSAKDSENVITFYYTKDSGSDDNGDNLPDKPSSRYLVTHYIQDIGSDTYSVYTTDDLIGVIGSEVHAEVLTIPGFTFNHATPNQKTVDGKVVAYGTVTSGEVAENALKLELYYNRIKYKYTVEYLDADTLLPIPSVTTKVTAPVYDFDSVVTETALQNIPGYDLYGSETQTLKISAIEDLNKITFLYNPKPLTVNYVPVCKKSSMPDFGYVLVTSEYKNINGTTAVAQPGFRFMGWYSDEDCNTQVANTEFYKPNVTTDGGIYDYTFYALFEPIDLTVTYNSMGGNEIDSDTSHIGETITLPTATRDGYTLLGWWYDADEDGTMDEGEEYAIGSEFTMPAKDVTFIAQWIDSRLAPSLNVYVGINMSFYMTSSGDLYYNIPDNEPRRIDGLAAARASYPETDRTAWYIQDWAWDAELPGKPTDYIYESVLTDGEHKNSIFGIANENGLTDYLKFDNNDYQNIVKVWLKECRNANGILRKNYSSANINWEQLPNDPSKYEVIPYVIKLHKDAHPDIAGMVVNAWHIDMIIRPAKRCKVSYLDGLDTAYTGTPVTDNNEYGEGFIIQLADAPIATKDDGNADCYATFLGWYYDADNNGTIEEAEKTTLYKPGDKFTVPALTENGQIIQFIGEWDYYGALTISQAGMENSTDSGIYQVVKNAGAADETVIATVMITGNTSVTLERVPVGTYTVREITGNWTWTYDPETETKSVTVVANPGAGDNQVTFTQKAKTVDWLHGEKRKP